MQLRVKCIFYKRLLYASHARKTIWLIVVFVEKVNIFHQMYSFWQPTTHEIQHYGWCFCLSRFFKAYFACCKRDSMSITRRRTFESCILVKVVDGRIGGWLYVFAFFVNVYNWNANKLCAMIYVLSSMYAVYSICHLRWFL